MRAGGSARPGRGRPAEAQDLQQKLAAAKQNAAQNQQALRTYTWIEKVELSLKGEVKNTTVNSCRYGPDGKVQKTPVVDAAAGREEARPAGQDGREEDRRDEGGARGRGGARPQLRAAGPGADPGGDERGHRLALPGGTGRRRPEVPRLPEGGRLAGPDLRLGREGAAADRRRQLPRRPEEPGDVPGRHAGDCPTGRATPAASCWGFRRARSRSGSRTATTRSSPSSGLFLRRRRG